MPSSSNFVFIFVSLAMLMQTITATGLFSKTKGEVSIGDATYYNPGPGSCGFTNAENEDIVAMNYVQMENGPNPNNNPLCDTYIIIKGSQGESKARIVDTCPKCEYGCLDLSPKVFLDVCGDLDKGRCTVRWKFM
ncbi:hypothetical protein O0I10_004073 [Lichtheimia ornata]|uniref:Uncharacterized protein n=1 Tax=Lichtheimia ornata TaxID=688661 RepID=A0AAD7V6G7_9FUNG|nr:uncharacterized protein O0I10_004073 [Lichtheimia ornata]KAJ8660213.1 hypothetical protein O0I10_004073 [Lichtheimia ornata]